MTAAEMWRGIVGVRVLVMVVDIAAAVGIVAAAVVVVIVVVVDIVDAAAAVVAVGDMVHYTGAGCGHLGETVPRQPWSLAETGLPGRATRRADASLVGPPTPPRLEQREPAWQPCRPSSAHLKPGSGPLSTWPLRCGPSISASG